MASAPIPVAILTGFLGAGKTTLLNFLLKDPFLADAAVIINEFGDVGIDHLLVERADENVIEMASGCLCCTIRGDLIDTIHDLLARRGRGEIKAFNRIVIETTGLADPAPVLHAVMSEPGLLAACRLALQDLGVSEERITQVQVPGALEIPIALAALAEREEFDALIALGCIIRGETYHFELVANESGAGVSRVALDYGIPIANAILTTENLEQAIARQGEKGRDAAYVAVEMAQLLHDLV